MSGFGRAAILLVGVSVAGTSAIHPQAAPKAPDPFASKVQPILAKYCYTCHGTQAKPKADLNLTLYASEAAVRDNRKIWKQALSNITTHLMPPDDCKVQPTPEERDVVARWIEGALNRVDPKAPVNPGRVTARRLNRAEYGNTVRDLAGVDFDPTEDFPSDDIGYGFDNIGDVLTLSPVHLERYLAAAESIVQRAFLADIPKPVEKHQGARYLEPAGRNVPQTQYRPIADDGGDAVRTGPLFTGYRIEPDGEYVFRFRAFAPKGPVKVAVLACGRDVANAASDADAAKLAGAALKGLRPFRILETIEIKAKTEKEARRTELKLPPLTGVNRLAVALVKGAKDAPPAEAHFDSFVLVGPLDPRPAFQRRMMSLAAGKPKAEQAREILRHFATRAFRRPVAEPELARLVKLVETVEGRGGKWEAGLQLALQAVLVSPKFLFRVELDDRPEAPEAHPISEHQLASRLSYFLWSSMPDDELRGHADRKTLAANLEAQVRRMLKDPRAQALVDNFAMQWLQLKRIQFVAPDGGLFPTFSNSLRQSMVKETELFLEAVFFEDRSILSLIDSDFTFLNERLARHYGIADTMGNRIGQKPAKPGGASIRGDAFVRVSLQGGERGGLITHASVLTVTSNPTRTSPVKRGRWVLEQILGQPPPPPPPDVPELPETAAAAQTGSLRQRMEQHRADPKCANCHTRMDAIGFSLENYNAVGAWRTKDGSFDIDPTGTFPDGTTFKGFAELRKVLGGKKDLFARCLTEKMMIYALGRGIEPYDERAVDRILAALGRDQHKFSTLIIEIAKSDPFRLRRGSNVKD